jgi:biotin operon repressor
MSKSRPQPPPRLARLKPSPQPRKRSPSKDGDHFVSTTLIRVRGSERMGGWAQIYRDVWTSEEFIGAPAIDSKGRRTRTKPLGRAGMAVYVYLATHTSGRAGTCSTEEDVSQKRMSDELGMSPNSIRRGVKELTERGLLTVRRGDHRGRRVPSYIYQLHDPPSLTRSGESGVQTNDPKMVGSNDPKMVDHPPPGATIFGSSHAPNMVPRREEEREQQNNSSRLGDLVNLHSDQSRSVPPIIQQLMKTRAELVEQHGEAKAEGIISRKSVEEALASTGWKRLGRQLPIGSPKD